MALPPSSQTPAAANQNSSQSPGAGGTGGERGVEIARQILSGSHPTVTMRNGGASQAHFDSYQKNFLAAAEQSPTFRRMLETLDERKTPVNIQVRPGGSGGQARLGGRSVSISLDSSFSGLNSPSHPSKMAIAVISNELLHATQQATGAIGRGPRPLIEFESDIATYQVLKEVFGKISSITMTDGRAGLRVLGNHGWPASFNGYDFRAARTIGIDVEGVINEGLKERNKPPLQGTLAGYDPAKIKAPSTGPAQPGKIADTTPSNQPGKIADAPPVTQPAKKQPSSLTSPVPDSGSRTSRYPGGGMGIPVILIANRVARRGASSPLMMPQQQKNPVQKITVTPLADQEPGQSGQAPQAAAVNARTNALHEKMLEFGAGSELQTRDFLPRDMAAGLPDLA
jgi:hypothetical protein